VKYFSLELELSSVYYAVSSQDLILKQIIIEGWPTKQSSEKLRQELRGKSFKRNCVQPVEFARC